MGYTSKCALRNVQITVGSADHTTRLEADGGLGVGLGLRGLEWLEREIGVSTR
jgi:hypothetical protein